MVDMTPSAPGRPPLPDAWPYPARSPLPAPELREGLALPGLEGTWTARLAPGLAFDRGPEGLPEAFGRGGVLRSGDVVLRPYRRGGLVRFLNRNLYPGPGRFRREDAVHRALWEAGLPTVEPLGWACRRRLWGWEGVFLTRLEAGRPWPRDWDARALPQVKGILEALSAWGLFAPDLNATNFLVRPDGQVLALDWDRAVWAPGVQLLPRYRGRLARSLSKLGAPTELVI